MIAPAGQVASRLAEALANGDVMYIALDEQRAEAVAAALRIAAPNARVVHSPSSDVLPGERDGASPANVGRRVAALHALRTTATLEPSVPLALITTAEAATATYPPPVAFDEAPPILAVGDAADLTELADRLAAIGYFADDRVDEPGEIAVRGQVIDLFPADSFEPVRIELADGRIAAIRRYDPVSQLGLEALDRIQVGRVTEPAADDRSVPLFDHVPDAAIAIDPGAERRRDRYVRIATEAARAGTGPALADAAIWHDRLDRRRTVDVATIAAAAVPRFVEAKSPMRGFARYLEAALANGDRVAVVGAERDLRFLAPRIAKVTGAACLTVPAWRDLAVLPKATIGMLAMPAERGWHGTGMAVVAAADLLGGRARDDRDVQRAAVDPLAGGMAGIRVGDTVVHEDFGIGRILGIEPLPAAGDAETAGDAIVLEYAGGAKRLVPVAEAGRLWRYGADADSVTLDKLDGSTWAKRRADIHAAIAETAKALTRLAAERARRTCPPLVPDVAAYERFAAGFAFTETADQARAIDAVRTDLTAGRPMERLVVGDVGYGKTEVALRAAAIAALAGRQVAIAAPTTVLVRQHLDVFARRFAESGLTVAALSRLSSPAERKAVKAGLADGSIAIVIGTGAIAARGAAYKDLALVVIDEEQRFGAADKARLRALNPDGHVLTMTATPIPRTLQSALIGLQQVSVIATPPARRQPIRTSVGPLDSAILRTALLRERSRRGQSFVVVPRIEDMAPMAARLRELVPDLVVRQAHGKLPPADVDAAMVAFAGGDGDVLLATNIIEAGLDVPRANTMIVWRADRFGLSQLHQLRGRVGRGGRRGQILLVTDPDKPIAAATLKRLRTLEALDRLGAGFAISARDLDMRGAGDLLGDAQAGHMKLIGIDLYQHLLQDALRAARGEPIADWSPVVRTGAAGCLPAEWIPEADIRLELYVRLARLATDADVDAFEAELEDRFGQLPAPAALLMIHARIRLLAVAAGIAQVDAGPAAIALTPRGKLSETPDGLTRKGERLLLVETIPDPGDRAVRAMDIVGSVASACDIDLVPAAVAADP
ncbi:MAG: helicase-related protein [Sphingomonas taxi]